MTSAVPFYIDAEARHPASVLRTLAWSAVEGKQGILHPAALAPRAQSTPGAGLVVDPGPFTINSRAPVGEFENYVDKLPIAEFVPVNPTSSAGPRTDLIIMRIENPYSGEPTAWTPTDPENGPYRRLVAVENVPSNINAVQAWNDTWSAIPICRITRPANTGTVEQSHISDLRSMAELGGDRITVINNPPPAPPPLSYPIYSESSLADVGEDLIGTDTNWTNFPGQVVWNVPVPEWATGMDVHIHFNAYFKDHCWGQMRLVIDGTPAVSAPTIFDLNYPRDAIDMPDMRTILIGGTEPIPASRRGRVIPMRLQGKFELGHTSSSRLIVWRGCYVNVLLYFKRNPVFD